MKLWFSRTIVISNPTSKFYKCVISRVSTALVVKEAISMILGKINSQPIEVAREISIVIHGKQCVNKNTCYFKGIFILLEGF